MCHINFLYYSKFSKFQDIFNGDFNIFEIISLLCGCPRHRGIQNLTFRHEYICNFAKSKLFSNIHLHVNHGYRWFSLAKKCGVKIT